jgi:hypothetical protein
MPQRPVQPVDLINKEHITGFEVGQDRDQIAGTLDGGTGRHAQIDAHLGGNDRRQRGLAESRRTVQQDVIERFPALARRFDEDRKGRFHPLLSDVLGQPLRA